MYSEIKQYALLLAEKYKKQQSKITWLSIRLPNIVTSVETNRLLNIAVTDLCVRKFSPESLILFVETGIQLQLDYLNRVCILAILTKISYTQINSKFNI